MRDTVNEELRAGNGGKIPLEILWTEGLFAHTVFFCGRGWTLLPLIWSFLEESRRVLRGGWEVTVISSFWPHFFNLS